MFLEDPTTIASILGFSIGFLYGESFSRFDQIVRYGTEWFLERSPFVQWLIASMLDVNHHFQYGLALMLLAKVATFPILLGTMLWWAGSGLVVSDWKDYEYVLKRMGLAGSQSQNVTQDSKEE